MLHRVFPLPGYLDDHHSEFLEPWMAYLHFREVPNLINYYTTIGKSTIIKEEHTTMENYTLLNYVNNLMYHSKLNFSEDTPNQILHMLSTLILWSKHFYTTMGQYPTLYDFLAIAPEDISHWEFYLAYLIKCAKPKIFQPTVQPEPLYLHMHDSAESPDVSVCHTISTTTSLPV